MNILGNKICYNFSVTLIKGNSLPECPFSFRNFRFSRSKSKCDSSMNSFEVLSKRLLKEKRPKRLKMVSFLVFCKTLRLSFYSLTIFYAAKNKRARKSTVGGTPGGAGARGGAGKKGGGTSTPAPGASKSNSNVNVKPENANTPATAASLPNSQVSSEYFVNKKE